MCGFQVCLEKVKEKKKHRPALGLFLRYFRNDVKSTLNMFSLGKWMYPYVFVFYLTFITNHQFLQWQPTPVCLPGKSHGQRSLVGYSPRGHKESDTTE